MDCSIPSFPVLHYLLESAQTHAHWVCDAIQPSRPLSSPRLQKSKPDDMVEWHHQLHGHEFEQTQVLLMYRIAWCAVHGVGNSRTELNGWTHMECFLLPNVLRTLHKKHSETLIERLHWKTCKVPSPKKRFPWQIKSSRAPRKKGVYWSYAYLDGTKLC